MEKKTAVVRNYKDTMFRMIFREKKELLELYNAVNGTEYTNTDDLEIVTLENAVYMNVKNDLAFILDFELHLYEHQSTSNPNIPLRDLFYVSSELQKFVNSKTLYSSAAKKIPTPRFYVFYNGTERQPEEVLYRLSDLFEKPMEEPDLELKVHMLNINYGQNAALMSGCRTLYEYSVYVKKVREYVAKMPLAEAVEQAISECIREGILEDFLRENRAEAIAVSIFEYDEEKEMKLIRQDEREAGMREGMIAMLIKMMKENHQPTEAIAERLQTECGLTPEEAETYLHQ